MLLLIRKQEDSWNKGIPIPLITAVAEIQFSHHPWEKPTVQSFLLCSLIEIKGKVGRKDARITRFRKILIFPVSGHKIIDLVLLNL